MALLVAVISIETPFEIKIVLNELGLPPKWWEEPNTLVRLCVGVANSSNYFREKSIIKLIYRKLFIPYFSNISCSCTPSQPPCEAPFSNLQFCLMPVSQSPSKLLPVNTRFIHARAFTVVSGKWLGQIAQKGSHLRSRVCALYCYIWISNFLWVHQNSITEFLLGKVGSFVFYWSISVSIE